MTPRQIQTVRLLTVEDVAERLWVGTRTVYRLISTGDLTAVHVHDQVALGRAPKTRVRVEDLATFIESRTCEPPS